MSAIDAVRVDKAVRQAVEALDRAPQVALACHVSPDGDALGSMLGLFHVLRADGRDVLATFPSPFIVAPHYRELPGLDLLTRPEDFPREPDVMVTFDCGSLGRLGDLEPVAKAARELIVIDHHISNDRYGTINAIDAEAAASGSLVHRIVRELGLPLNRDAAVCLYAALVCDTGRFQYETTTPAVFAMARELLQHDVPVSRLSRMLFEEHRFAYLKLMADALSRAELVPQRRFVWTVVTQADLERHGVAIEEVEGLIDILRRTAEAEVTCVLKEESDGTIRVSLRSLGDVDVRMVAEAEGGGGHRFAAGFSSDDTIDAVVARIETALPRALGMATHGAVIVDKEAGWTSHDVVARLRKVYGQRRVGHAGTLDPDATGVLFVGLGRATRLLRFVQESGKAYRGTIAFGVSTTTLDAAGDVVDRAPMSIERADVERAARAFVGEIEQLPPMVSAVKVKGRRLHQLARQGIEVDREPRRVRVDRFEVESFEPGPYPTATVLVECGSGTYIRSLAADVGERLGGAAHLASLRRLRVGSFAIEEARPLAAIEADPEAVVIPPVEAMRDLARVDVDAEQARAITHGVTFPAPVLIGEDTSPGPFAIVAPDGELLAVYERRRSALKPTVVLAPVEAS